MLNKKILQRIILFCINLYEEGKFVVVFEDERFLSYLCEFILSALLNCFPTGGQFTLEIGEFICLLS